MSDYEINNCNQYNTWLQDVAMFALQSLTLFLSYMFIQLKIIIISHLLSKSETLTSEYEAIHVRIET